MKGLHPLENLSSLPITITWHENERVYLSVKKNRGLTQLRIHRLFFDAPTPVLQALIDYALKRDPKAKVIIRQMAHLYFSQNHKKPKELPVNGKVYDLQEIFNRLNQSFFLEGVCVGWGEKGGWGKFRSITFGTYNAHTRQIRINPILDHKEVPLYFLEYIVYHEMLHAIYPTQMAMSGRCAIHTKEFREKERQFPLFEEAKRWEKKSLMILKKVSCGRP